MDTHPGGSGDAGTGRRTPFMALKPFFDNLESVPEALRPFYVERDGKAVIDLEGGWEDVGGLKSALGRHKTEVANLKARTKRFEDLGITDPDQLSNDLAELERLRQIDPKSEAGRIAEERIKSVADQLKASHAKELGKVTDTATRYRARLESHLVDNAAITALNEHRGNVRLLLPHVKANTRVVEDGGDFRLEVIDAAGNPRIGRKGEAMTVSELVESMRADDTFAAAFAADNRQGSGHPPSGSGGGRTGSGGKVRITVQEAQSGKYIDQIAAGQVEIVDQ